jgi:hypothetical protein
MAVIYANPTGIYKGVYRGITPTKNADYLKVSLDLESDNVVPSSESIVFSAKDAQLYERLKQLEVGKPYQYFMSCNVQESRTDEITGKRYRARVQYKLLKVL